MPRWVVFDAYAPAALLTGERIWPFLGIVISGPSLIGILGSMGVLQIGVKPWEIPILHIPWTKSLFMDSNYSAVVAFVGLVSSMYGCMLSNTRRLKLIWATLSIINFVSMSLCYSRAAYLATFMAATVWFLTSKKFRWYWKVMLTTSAVVTLVLLATWALKNPEIKAFLQVERGMTGRELLWPAAIKAIAERPLFGWGVGNVDDVVLSTVGHWVSTHNTFLDFAIMTGIPGVTALLWIITASVMPLLHKTDGRSHQKRFLLTLLSGLLTTTQFITFTPGGAGFASFIFALALGQANVLRIRAVQASYPPALDPIKRFGLDEDVYARLKNEVATTKDIITDRW